MKDLETSIIDIKCKITKGAIVIDRARVTETYDVSNLLKEFVEYKLQTKLVEEDRVQRPLRLKYAVSKIKEKIAPYCSRTFIVPKMIEVAGGQVFQVGMAEAVKWIQ